MLENENITDEAEVSDTETELEPSVGDEAAKAGEAFSQNEEVTDVPELDESVVERVRELALDAARARELYPELDITEELRDPVFVKLMAVAEGDVRRAYEMKHHERIITNAMRYAAERTEQRLAEAMASRQSRPFENAVSGGSAVMMTDDPKNLTRAQRSEIKKRVRRGEKILW